MNEQVGVISYKVEIDVESLKAGTKSAEQAIKTSFSASEQAVSKSTNKMSKEVDNLTRRLNSLEQGLKPIATGAGIASAAVVAGFGTAAKAAFEQVRAVENASFGLKAYEKDAQAVSTVLSQLVAYARSDEGVLFQREELFQAASTLKGFGEATANLTDRVKILAQGVAVGNTTFAELSQIIGRTAQSGRLTAEAYDQLAYRGIILDSSLRGAAVGADELYQALDNAIDDSILADRANTIDGLLTRLNSAWRDLGGTILGVDKQTSTFIQGGLGMALVNTIGQMTTFIRENQSMIAGVGTMVVTFGTLTGGLYLAVRAISAVRAALVALGIQGAVAQARMLGVIGAISAIAGVAAGFAIEKHLNDSAEAADDLNVALDDTTNFSNAAAGGVNNLSKQLQDLDKQIARTERDYIENLTKIVRKHQESVRDLTKQIEDENARYNRAVQERTRQFEDEQDTEVQKHQEKTKNLQNQIDFLRKYNNKNNAQQLSELEFALARENAQYQERNAELNKRYQEDVAAEQGARNKKLADLNSQLAEEQGVLNKHRDSVKQVRNVMLLDEIDMLKRSRQEQIASYEQQRRDAISNNAASGSAGGGAFRNSFNDQIDKLVKDMDGKGKSAANSFGGGFVSDMNKYLVNNYGWAKTLDNFFYNLGTKMGGRVASGAKSSGSGGGGWSQGGYTGAGGRYEPAGIVHKGEYVIPKPLVNQATGLPKAEALGAIAGTTNSTSNNYTINIPISGAIVTSAQDQRKFAEVIGKRLNEIMTQKGYKPSIQGV